MNKQQWLKYFHLLPKILTPYNFTDLIREMSQLLKKLSWGIFKALRNGETLL